MIRKALTIISFVALRFDYQKVGQGNGEREQKQESQDCEHAKKFGLDNVSKRIDLHK